MARIAIVMSNFWPEPTGGAPTCTEFAVFLQQSGHEVTVVTSMPYYPQWQIWPEYRGRLWRNDVHHGVRVRRAWHLVSPSVSTMVRIMHEATLSLMSLPSLIRTLLSADIVFLFTPALSFAWLGSVLARLLGVPRIAVVKDVMPDAAIELGMMTNPVMIGISRALARSLYNSSEEVHTLGEGMARRIQALAARPETVRIVPDTVDGTELSPVPRAENEYRKKFVKGDPFVVLHTGNMGKKQDLMLILRTAALMKDDPSIQFHVFGDGAMKTQFLAERDRLGLSNVLHFDLQERWMLRHMLSGADVVLVSQLAEVVDIVVPSKLLTAMVSGSMIVATCTADSAPALILNEGKCGLVSPAEDEAKLAALLRQVKGGAFDTESMRRKAREHALATFGREAVYGPVSREVRDRFVR
jgi:colanic acid biosynthesis glycosyl transferase WcaI